MREQKAIPAQRKVKAALPENRAWHPAPWEKADVHAVRALAAGTASPEQQKRALDWIIHKAAGTYDMTFRPEGDRDSCFAEGRRFVGNSLVKLLKIDLSTLKD